MLLRELHNQNQWKFEDNWNVYKWKLKLKWKWIVYVI